MDRNGQGETMLTVQGLGHWYGDNQVLADISLTLAAGEIICLVGQSGCGKSTLLRIIAGVDRAHTGRIALNGAEIMGASGFVEPEDRKIGFMFQDYALFPHLSVADNVSFGLKRLPRADARRRVQEVMEIIGIPAMAERFPHTLSGGEQQRVALARALAPQPALLLMDEPFSNLDRGLSEHVREETLATLRKLGIAAIIVTHDPEEALAAGDRVVLMKSGRIVQSGSGRDIHDRPNSLYAAEFFRPCNRLGSVVQNGQIITGLGAFPAPGLADGAPALACVRQHGLRLATAGDGVRAEVTASAFLGDVEQLTLHIPGESKPLIMRIMGEAPCHAGDVIWITTRASEVLVFADTLA